AVVLRAFDAHSDQLTGACGPGARREENDAMAARAPGLLSFPAPPAGDQNVHRVPDQLVVELLLDAPLEREELMQTLRRKLVGDLGQRQPRRRGARPRRVLESEELREAHPLDQPEGGAVVFLGLAWEANDEVGRHGESGPRPAQVV